MPATIIERTDQGLGILFTFNRKEWQVLPEFFDLADAAERKCKALHRENQWLASQVITVVRTIDVPEKIKASLVNKLSR